MQLEFKLAESEFTSLKPSDPVASFDRAISHFRKAAELGHRRAKLSVALLQNADWTSTASTLQAKYAQAERLLSQSLIRGDELQGDFKPLPESQYSQALKCSYKGRTVVAKALNEGVGFEVLDEWSTLMDLQKPKPHPNVLPFLGACYDLDCVATDGKRYQPVLCFVSPFMEHGSIEDFLKDPQNAGLSRVYLRRWAMDIADALSFMHHHNRIHRDLYARNVFIDEISKAVVGDFGLTRALPGPGQVYMKTTREYLLPVECAPEAFLKSQYDASADIFSFAITLFEIATENAGELFKQNIDDTLPPSQQLADYEKAHAEACDEIRKLKDWNVHTTIIDVMLRCFAIDSGSRPAAAHVMADLVTVPVEDTKRDYFLGSHNPRRCGHFLPCSY